MIDTTLKTLYETDFALWIAETLSSLRSKDMANIDFENLIEEVEALGISQRKSLESFLVRLFEHLLKRCYVALPDCYRNWEIEIRNFRRELKRELKYSPSLKRFMLEIWDEAYQEALEAVKNDYPKALFPDLCPFSLEIETLLSKNFWDLN
ncbi:MAG: DUF29 domain-containing protein [Snowella sp.]|nr:DUF29 domain-containing protein [Snowella sp.]